LRGKKRLSYHTHSNGERKKLEVSPTQVRKEKKKGGRSLAFAPMYAIKKGKKEGKKSPWGRGKKKKATPIPLLDPFLW